MRKIVLLMCMLYSLTWSAFAQTRQVTGKVVDKGGEALIGVSVLLKGTSQGVSTDATGNFKINVPNSGTHILVFKYLGFKTKEVSALGQSKLDIVLEEDVATLEEVKVNIGYAMVSKEAVTGSVSSVGSKQLKDVPVSTAAEALTGRLAGVQVTTTEGRPGAEIQIRVRGGGSLTQDNSPLYIVDGIQVENALSILSPQEIQSIDVLKDAASTAIYGARGANGVVLITTKGGKEMKTQVSYNGFSGVRNIINTLDVMKPYDFVMYQYQRYNGSEDDQKSFIERYGNYQDLDIYKNMPFTNWQDEVFGRSAWNQNHTLSLTGGSKTTTFNFNLNHTDEDGIMLQSGYNRTLASFKFDHKATDRFRVGLNTRYSRQKIDGVGTSSTGSQGTNRLRNSVRYSPYIAPGMESQIDVFDPDYANLTNLTNPVLLTNNELKYDYRNDVNVTGYFSFDIIKNLTLRSTVGVTNTNSHVNSFSGTVTSLARQNRDMPVTVMNKGEVLTLNNSNTISYKLNLSKDHNADVLLGQELYQTNSEASSITTKYLPVDITAKQAFAGIQKATPPAGLLQDAPTSSEAKNRLISFFGRANYSYKSKYMGTVTMRYDGSSKFAKENRFASFPSVQLGWRMSEEAFMKDIAWLSSLKLRAGYGTSGNNRIGDDLFKTMFNASGDYGYAFDESVTPGMASPNLANANLVWETTIARNLGVDFSVLKNRLNGSVDIYYNNTKDLLLNANIPQTSGYSKQIQNVGKTENRGIELQLDGTILSKKDFTWSANFNISFNRNKIASLGLDPSGQSRKSYLESSGWVNNLQDFYIEVGKPVGQFYGYVTDGFYGVDDFDYDASTQKYTLKAGIPNSSIAVLGSRPVQPGDLKLKKLSQDNNMVIGEADKTVLGNAQPLHTGGFNQQFTFKGFDMSVFMNWSYGNEVYNANKIEYTTAYQYKDNNMLAIMNDRFKLFDANGAKVTDPDQLRAMNVNAKYWTPSLGNYALHSFAIEDGSFLRISNITLGYTLPQSLLKRTKAISSLRVYATVNNLWTITGYSGYDPEANTRRSNPLTPSVDYAAYPRSRFILGGINLTL